MSSELESLLAKAKTHPMTDAEREAQRQSFAYGNVKLHNDAITREMVADASERLQRRIENQFFRNQ